MPRSAMHAMPRSAMHAMPRSAMHAMPRSAMHAMPALTPCAASCCAGDMEIDQEVYEQLRQTGAFEVMSLDVDEVGG
jgi:hypothetical protein